jgi:hydrogenase maturation protease
MHLLLGACFEGGSQVNLTPLPEAEQAASRGKDTLVLGIGNPVMGDDGIGCRAVELLAGRDLPAGVRVEEAGVPGWGLPNWLEGWSRVILIDAVQMGEMPGTWRRFSTEQVRLIASGQAISLHEPGLASGLELAQALGQLPEKIVIYGIEPAGCSPGQGLSPAACTALPGLIETICAEIWNGN